MDGFGRFWQVGLLGVSINSNLGASLLLSQGFQDLKNPGGLFRCVKKVQLVLLPRVLLAGARSAQKWAHPTNGSVNESKFGLVERTLAFLSISPVWWRFSEVAPAAWGQYKSPWGVEKVRLRRLTLRATCLGVACEIRAIECMPETGEKGRDAAFLPKRGLELSNS